MLYTLGAKGAGTGEKGVEGNAHYTAPNTTPPATAAHRSACAAKWVGNLTVTVKPSE